MSPQLKRFHLDTCGCTSLIFDYGSDEIRFVTHREAVEVFGKSVLNIPKNTLCEFHASLGEDSFGQASLEDNQLTNTAVRKVIEHLDTKDDLQYYQRLRRRVGEDRRIKIGLPLQHQSRRQEIQTELSKLSDRVDVE